MEFAQSNFSRVQPPKTVSNSKSSRPSDVTTNNRKKLCEQIKQSADHVLKDTWVLWGHLPHDTDWTIKSYIKIMEFNTLENMIALYRNIPEAMVKNCMLFLMRKNIMPIWEDKKNKNGGCFSFKVTNKSVPKIWKQMSYVLAGNTLTKDAKFANNINGITISPKKSFCIMKIWVSNTLVQHPRKLVLVKGLNQNGCIFKKHKPEY